MKVIHDILIRQEKGPCFGACYYIDDNGETRVMVYKKAKTPAMMIADIQASDDLSCFDVREIAEKVIFRYKEKWMKKLTSGETISRQAVLRICNSVINSNSGSKATLIRKRVMSLPIIEKGCD